jgi:hypothetical protein
MSLAVIARASDRLEGFGNSTSASPNPVLASRTAVSETTMKPADADTPVTRRTVPSQFGMVERPLVPMIAPAVVVMPMTIPAVESLSGIGIEAVCRGIVQGNDVPLGPG